MLLHNPQTTHLFNINIEIIMVLPIYRPGYPKSFGQRRIAITAQDLNMAMIISGLLIFDNNSEYISKRDLIWELFLKTENVSRQSNNRMDRPEPSNYLRLGQLLHNPCNQVNTNIALQHLCYLITQPFLLRT